MLFNFVFFVCDQEQMKSSKSSDNGLATLGGQLNSAFFSFPPHKQLGDASMVMVSFIH